MNISWNSIHRRGIKANINIKRLVIGRTLAGLLRLPSSFTSHEDNQHLDFKWHGLALSSYKCLSSYMYTIYVEHFLSAHSSMHKYINYRNHKFSMEKSSNNIHLKSLPPVVLVFPTNNIALFLVTVPLCMCHFFLSSVVGRLGWLCSLAIMENSR